MDSTAVDEKWMGLALAEASKASEVGEVPVGAVLVDQARGLLAAAGNGPIARYDPTAHAEIIVLRQAGQACGNYRLPGTTLYVTLEPCVMCAGALVQARVERVVFGALDPKAGALVSRYQVGSDGLLNHSLQVTGGVLAGKCAGILKDFFRSRRLLAKQVALAKDFG